MGKGPHLPDGAYRGCGSFFRSLDAADMGSRRRSEYMLSRIPGERLRLHASSAPDGWACVKARS